MSEAFKFQEVRCYRVLEFWMFNSLLKPLKLEDAKDHNFLFAETLLSF